MDRSNVIRLIAPGKQVEDQYGVDQPGEETARAVFCNVKSARADDFIKGYRNGLNLSYVFTMFRYDYQGEAVVEFDGKRYAVLRTYLKGTDSIELHTVQKGGTNGEH